MNKQPPTTEEILNQLGTERIFSRRRGRLDPYTPEELDRLEQDQIKASEQEAARRAAETVYLAERRQRASSHMAEIIDITQAPSYVVRPPEQPEAEPITHQEAQ